MKRRTFLKLASAVPLMASGLPLSLIGRSAAAAESGKVLVLIQLLGGNDGLNTVLPIDQYDNLAAVRSNIVIPESSIIPLTGNLGLHPSMQNMADVWFDGKLRIVQSVGYPDQNRSHFRSQDIWNTASRADEFISTGWLGRWFEESHGDYPFGYPSPTDPHPLALTIGDAVSETCQGTLSNFSLAVTDPFNPGTVNAGVLGPIDDSCYGSELSYVQQVAAQTNGYSAAISDAANAGNNVSTLYPDDGSNPLASSLATVARLISGGLGTKIYVVRMGGFDTHAAQVLAGDPTQGVQAGLLAGLSQAIAAFQDDLKLLGVDQQVVGMTYSEFGRRIRSNASLGTDHGSAAPQFVFGSSISGGVLGDNPQISPRAGIDEGVAMQHDFRNLYGTLFTDWLGVDEASVRRLLFDGFQRLPIFYS